MTIRAQADVAEIDIFDDIGKGAITAEQIREQLKGKPKQILVRMNSSGGDVTEGLAIYGLLREASQNGAQVTCSITGLCASIATVIACGADVVQMADSAFYMIHDPSGEVAGGANDLRSFADVLDSMKQRILNIYIDRTHKPAEELSTYCADETWMTAEEAMANGFIDEIVPAKGRIAAKWDLKNFKKVPQGLGAKLMDEKEYDKLKAEHEDLKDRFAKMEDALAEFKKAKEADDKDDEDEDEKSKKPDEDEDGDEDGDEDEGDEKDAKASARARVIAAAKAITGVQDLESLEGALYGLSTKAKGVRSGKAQHAERVSKAIADGKLMPSQKAWALSATPKAFAAYLTSVGDAVVGPLGVEHQPSDSVAKAMTDKSPPVVLSKSEKSYCAQMKITEEDFIKMRNAQAPAA